MSEPTQRVTAATDDPNRPGKGVRASDADRYATVAVLQDAVARGLLTPTEGSDRMSAAFAAVHLENLNPMTADLPEVFAPARPVGWRPLLLMVLEQLQSSLHSALTGRRPAHLGAALLIVLLLITCGLTFAHLVLDTGSDPGDGRFGRH